MLNGLPVYSMQGPIIDVWNSAGAGNWGNLSLKKKPRNFSSQRFSIKECPVNTELSHERLSTSETPTRNPIMGYGHSSSGWCRVLLHARYYKLASILDSKTRWQPLLQGFKALYSTLITCYRPEEVTQRNSFHLTNTNDSPLHKGNSGIFSWFMPFWNKVRS